MFTTNIFNNNALISNNINNTKLESSWCDIRSITNKQELSLQYADICQQHELHNKWVLMINPDEKPLLQLSKQGIIDPSRILKVNINQRDIKMKSIEEALEKGHCSAVILCNATLEKSQVNQLKYYAKKGKTRCIILKKQTQNTQLNLVQKNLNRQHLSLELH